jgi:F-type H+-transporting ATPase subunit b
MEILGKLGINGKILLAQVVNFFLLMYLLKRFLYKPILDILKERQNKIDKGLRDAEKAEKKFQAADEKIQLKIDRANQKVDLILAKAEKESKEYREETEKEAKEKINQWEKEAKQHIGEEKAKIVEDVKKQISPLIIEVAQKIISQKINGKDRLNLTKEIGMEIKKIKGKD